MQYRPEIDGLRAVAVIPVVLFHLGWPFVKGGFLGVDVFFVISGYLITSIALKNYEEGTFTLAAFWLRRVRRIFPALAVLVIVTSLVYYFVMFRNEFRTIGFHGISALMSYANISMWRLRGGYWGGDAEATPFLHTWSLSVEEQFYILFPFVMVTLMRVRKRWFVGGLAGIAALSYLLYYSIAVRHPSAAFFMLPPRAWELAGGCLLAVCSSHVKWVSSVAIASTCSLLGFIALIISYGTMVSNMHPALVAVVPVVGSLLILAYGGCRRSMVNRLLSSRVLVSVGKISYSIYLWHWPIIVIKKSLWPVSGLIADTAALITIMGVASLSYFAVEKPARHRDRIMGLASIMFVVAMGSCLVLVCANKSYDCTSFIPSQWRGQAYNVNPVDTWPESVKRRMEGVVVTERDPRAVTAYRDAGIIKTYGSPTPDIVVLGDSHGLMWSGVIDDIAKGLHLSVSFCCADGTSPFLSASHPPAAFDAFSLAQRKEFDQMRLFRISEWKPRIVIIGARWSDVSDVAEAMVMLSHIATNGCRILLVEQPPELNFGDRNARQYLAYSGFASRGSDRQYMKSEQSEAYARGFSILRELVGKNPSCEIIPVADLFLNGKSDVWVLDGADVLYIDDDHLSEAGARKMRDRLLSAVRRYTHGSGVK